MIDSRSFSPPAPSFSSRTSWSWKDTICSLALLSRAFSISSAPLLPISPIVFFSFLLLTVCIHDVKRAFAELKRTPSVLPYLGLIGFQVFTPLAIAEWNYDTVSKVARIASAAAFMLALTGYILAAPATRLKRIITISLCAMGLSALWFILEITITEPFVGLRLMLYSDSYLRFEWLDEGEFTRSGLCPFLHILGYQLSFLVPVLLVTESRFLTRRMRFMRFLGVLVGGFSIYFSSQRSVFFASAFTLLLFMYYSTGKRLTRRILALVVFLLVLLPLTASLEVWDTDYLQASITDKLINFEHWNEAIFRLELQWQALKVIFTNPLGLADPVGGWIELGFWPVHEASSAPPFNQPVAVHNGYLGQSLEFGVPFLLLTVALLWGILRLTHRNIEKSSGIAVSDLPLTRAIAASTPGLFLLQSTTHNASLITEDATCLIVFSLLIAVDIMNRRSLSFSRLPAGVQTG